MPDDKNEPNRPSGAASGRSNRPTTIDLKATEISPEPAPKPEPEPATAPVSQAPGTEGGGSKGDEAPRQAEKAADKPAADAATSGDAPRPDPAPPVYPAPPARSPWSAIGIALASVVFFAGGLAAGYWWATHATPPVAASGGESRSAELLARIDRIETQLDAARKNTPQLDARLSKLESALKAAPATDPQLQERLAKLESQLAAPRADDPQLLARIAAAESAVKTLTDMMTAREKRNDELAALARDAHERASSAITAAEAAKNTQAASPEARADLEAVAKRIATLEETARGGQAELARRMATEDAKGRFALTAIALRDAVDKGAPFAAELASAKSHAADAASVAVLEPYASTGVPSAQALGRELSSLMPALWKAARGTTPQTGTFLERLQANAGNIIRIRPAGDVAGDDHDSIRARIEARAATADIDNALSELMKLPPEVRAPAEAWIKKAQARNAAVTAARNIAQTAIGALAKSGS